MKDLDLGMAKNGTVLLTPHSEKWCSAFLNESLRLANALKIEKARIHHVGSTAIRGIVAKPILDILLAAPTLEDLDSLRSEIESLGYIWKGEASIPGRRYSVMYNADQTLTYVHLHGFAQTNPAVQSHLAFRDYLNAHPEVAQAYQKLKLELNGRKGMTREVYTESKTSFIQEVLTKALTHSI
jgi:GrpB-like predicted nucleotidyltransferase (UPF0157 family)